MIEPAKFFFFLLFLPFFSFFFFRRVLRPAGPRCVLLLIGTRCGHAGRQTSPSDGDPGHSSWPCLGSECLRCLEERAWPPRDRPGHCFDDFLFLLVFGVVKFELNEVICCLRKQERRSGWLPPWALEVFGGFSGPPTGFIPKAPSNGTRLPGPWLNNFPFPLPHPWSCPGHFFPARAL